ncbi:MAG: hypothetical protein OEZ44_10200, partial [Candidatus Bathyarchaeota archaeon]|nr:hypothetical protein [Candidatus Bathyarchaeota archaeon]
EFQKNLGGLTEDQRLVRAHMAEFCRASPLFPEAIDILCREIGAGRIVKSYKLGCEGRNLLESLGFHDVDSMREQRILYLEEYSGALRRWLSGGAPQTPMEAKVSGFLGEVTESREALVNDILSHLESGERSSQQVKETCEAECRRRMGGAFDTRARPLHCFDCPGGRVGEGGVPECPCAHRTLIDVGLLCTRVNEDWRSVLREYRRFVEEYVLAYTLALNSWLEGTEAKPVDSLMGCVYVTEDTASGIPVMVHASLGERDDFKTWLAACLLKTLKSNQRWHGVEEAIDSFPEAGSWLLKRLEAR